MADQPALDPEMFDDIDLLLNWDLLEREEDWDVYLAIDDTPPKDPPKPKKKADEQA